MQMMCRSMFLLRGGHRLVITAPKDVVSVRGGTMAFGEDAAVYVKDSALALKDRQ